MSVNEEYLPRGFAIETTSYCNRQCSLCPRQNEPTQFYWDDDGTKLKRLMPASMVYSILDQLVEMRFRGQASFNGMNEPLTDVRIPDFIDYASTKGLRSCLFTNGNFLTEDIASKLDGLLETIVISIYPDEITTRAEILRIIEPKFRSYFQHTQVVFVGIHHPVPYSPHYQQSEYIAWCADMPCDLPLQCFQIRYNGDASFCTFDIARTYSMFNINDMRLKEIISSNRYQDFVDDLQYRGGRQKYELCRVCPWRPVEIEAFSNWLDWPHWKTRGVFHHKEVKIHGAN